MAVLPNHNPPALKKNFAIKLVKTQDCGTAVLQRLRERKRHQPLPSMAAAGQLIYRQGSENSSSLLAMNDENAILLMEATPSALLDLLLALYPDLGCFELLRIHEVAPQIVDDLSLFQHMHLAPSAENLKFLNQLLELPCQLQDHLDEKKVRVHELQFLRSWPAEKTLHENLSNAETELASSLDLAFQTALKKIVDLGMGLQNTLRAMELLLELRLMEKLSELNKGLQAATEAEFLSEIQKLRFPMSHQIEEARKSDSLQIQWPAFAKAKVLRRGDRTGFEVQAFIASESDVVKTMATLERVKESFAQGVKF